MKERSEQKTTIVDFCSADADICAVRDSEIKKLLREELVAEILRADPSSLVIEEMQICRGDARIDVTVINGRFIGYEIKSSLDDLRRLPNQIKLYSRVLDSVSIVVDAKHIEKAEKQIPAWWGIIIVGDHGLRVIRETRDNPSLDPLAVAALLWREEALSILVARGLDRGIRSKPREAIWQRLASSLPIQELKQEVRNKIRARIDWRAESPQKSDDVLFPPFSM